MTVYIAMQAPTTWPFLTPVVPVHLMPSGNAYRPDSSGQIQAYQTDVGALAGYGFALPGTQNASTQTWLASGGSDWLTQLVNLPLCLRALANPTQGDGTLHFKIDDYVIETVPF